MRGKQQSSRPHGTVVLAAAGVLASCLAAALITPAFAAPAGGPGSKARPGVMVTGQPVGIAADTVNHSYWVAERDTGQHTDSVDKIFEKSHAIVNVHVKSGVNAIAADAGRGLVWVIGNSIDGSTHTVTYIKESNRSVHAVTVPAGSDLTGVAVDPAAGKVFVIDLTGNVFTFDESHLTNAPVKFITGSLSAASGVAVDHGTSRIWVLNAAGNSVFEFSESTGATVGSPVNVGDNPQVIAIDASTETVWVGNSDSTLSEFREASPGTVHSTTLGSVPTSITADPARRLMWVGGEFGSITGVTERTSPPSLTGGLTVPSEVDGLATDQTTGQLWVTENVTSQGAFNNVVPFVPTAPKLTTGGSTWFAAGNTAQDQFTLTASGFPPSTFSMRGAPSWLSLAKLSGLLSAKLTSKSKLGAFKITLTASNGIGAAAHRTFTVNVGTDPVVRTTSATFAFGVPNSIQLKALGTPAPTFKGLNLPKGLHLSSTGVLSGSLPKGTASPKMFGIEANNKVTAAFSSPVFVIFTLKLAPGVAAKITSASKVTFRHGRRGAFTVTTTGLPRPSLKESGKLPKGLRFGVVGGRAFVTGTPAKAGAGHTFKITITASNGVGRSARQTLTIKIT